LLLPLAAAGDVARKYIKDQELLRFIDLECFIWSTVSADLTPMINAGMVFCDRHFGGINYPVGGVGQIAEEMAAGELMKWMALWKGSSAVALLAEQGY
jgi:phytoene dehydrogenase-like protein